MTSAASGVSGVGSGSSSEDVNKSLGALGTEDFLKLLITQLKNQDPTEPMDNQEVLAQLSAIRELESNAELTNSLRTLNEQNRIGTAAGILGKEVTAVNLDGVLVNGQITKALVGEDDIGLTIRGPMNETYSAWLTNVLEIREREPDGGINGTE